MKVFWHNLKRVAILLCAAVWFQTVAHTVVCHSDNALCGHDECSESTVCACACHIAYECTFADEPICPVATEAYFVPSSDETVCGILLPCDIFRPPLAQS